MLFKKSLKTARMVAVGMGYGNSAYIFGRDVTLKQRGTGAFVRATNINKNSVR